MSGKLDYDDDVPKTSSRRISKLIEANHSLKIVANTDPLTGATHQHRIDVVEIEMTRHIENITDVFDCHD